MNASLLRRTITVVVVAIFVVAAALFAARIPRTIAIFLIAAFIAFGANPLVARLDTKMPRWAAITVVYIGLLGVLVVLALVIVPITVAQFGVLVNHAPEYVAASENVVARVEHALRHILGDRVPLPSYGAVQIEVGNRVSAFLAATFAQLGTLVVGAVTALVVGTSALILSVFFLLQGGEVRDGILAFVPAARRPAIAALMNELVDVFGHFVSGQALLCAIVGAAVWVALAPTHFGFPLIVALICAIGYAIPFVGMIAAQIVAALLAVPQGTGMVVWVTVAIFVIARVADNVLVPKVMAQSVGVSPITVMFAVFAGGELFGIPGLILGIPAAALIRVLFRYFVQPYVVRMQTQAPEIIVEPTAVATEPAAVEDPRAAEPESESVVVTMSR
jgi:predicted PurR-regulated permease PerM